MCDLDKGPNPSRSPSRVPNDSSGLKLLFSRNINRIQSADAPHAAKLNILFLLSETPQHFFFSSHFPFGAGSPTRCNQFMKTQKIGSNHTISCTKHGESRYDRVTRSVHVHTCTVILWSRERRRSRRHWNAQEKEQWKIFAKDWSIIERFTKQVQPM